MTTTLDACAAALAEIWDPDRPWEYLSELEQHVAREAARACLGALLPVSDGIALIGAKAASPFAQGQQLMLSQAKARAAITAAIRHVIEGGE